MLVQQFLRVLGALPDQGATPAHSRFLPSSFAFHFPPFLFPDLFPILPRSPSSFFILAPPFLPLVAPAKGSGNAVCFFSGALAANAFLTILTAENTSGDNRFSIVYVLYKLANAHQPMRILLPAGGKSH